MATSATDGRYLPLDTACRDIGVFAGASFVLGALIVGAGIYFAVSAEKMLAGIVALSYFPFATTFILSQHLVSLRIKRAEYAGASAVRRQRIAAEVRQYQEMMLKSGLTAPVVGVVGALRMKTAGKGAAPA